MCVCVWRYRSGVVARLTTTSSANAYANGKRRIGMRRRRVGVLDFEPSNNIS